MEPADDRAGAGPEQLGVLEPAQPDSARLYPSSPIVERYNKELVRILHMPAVRSQLEKMEFEVVAGTPEQFAQWIHTEIPRWGKVIKATGAKAD